MMMKSYRHLFTKRSSRFYSSALYITGDKAQTNFAVLTPVIDFDKQLKHKDDLFKNVKARGLQIDIENVVKRWVFFQDLLQRKNVLEDTRIEIGQSVAKLLKLPSSDPSEIDKLKLHAKMIKEDLKNLKESFYDIEETTLIKVFSLPNVLHPKTPLDKEHIVYTYLEKPSKESLGHMQIGAEMKLLKFIDPFTCYLKSDAALFELKLLSYFRKALLNSNYLQFSNPNFCRSVISEGCNKICSTDDMFTIEEQHHEDINKLHLCGGASLYSFMSYFSRHLVPQNIFPVNYFSIGKIYHPVNNKVRKDLFNLSQESVVRVFLADLEDSNDRLDFLIKEICDIYNSLGVHYRLAILPANKISNSESLRISIQMYSNFEQKYIEVGNVSLYNNYISKRLLFTYIFNKEKKFPKIVSGSLLNFHRFLGCVLENVDNNLILEYLRSFCK